MADVDVSIGAKIDELINAVDQVKGKIEEISDTSKHTAESMGAVWANAVMEIAAKALEAAEKIGEFVAKMAEMGEKTERIAAALGVSAQDVGALSIVAKATGGDIDSMALTIERLYNALQKADHDALSPAAQALHRLGLTAREFKGLNADQMLLKIADAAGKFHDGLNMSSTMMDLGGRRMQGLIATLQSGGDEIRRLEARVKDLGFTLDKETTEALKRLDTEIKIAKQGLEMLGADIVGKMSGPLTWLIDKFNTLVSSLKWLVDNAGRLAEMFGEELGFKVPSPETPNVTVHGHGEEEKDKRDVGAYDALLKQDLELAKIASEEQIALATIAAQEQKDINSGLVAQFKMTKLEEIAANAEASQKMYDAQLSALLKEAEAVKILPLEYANVMSKIHELTAKANAEMLKSTIDTTKQMAAEYQKLGDIIASSFTSNIRGLLEGTLTWRDAMVKTLEDIIVKLLEAIAKAIILKAVMAAGEAAGFPGSGVLSLLKLQDGTPNVPETQLALVHQGEMVIPSNFANAIRSGEMGIGSGGGGGGGNVAFTISAWDSSSVTSWLRAGGAEMIARHVGVAWNQNPTLRPSY